MSWRAAILLRALLRGEQRSASVGVRVQVIDELIVPRLVDFA